MFKHLMLLALLLILSACTGTGGNSSSSESSEHDAVLTVIDAYMHEISANDLAAMDARQTPEGMTYQHVKLADGQWKVRHRSNKEWVAPDMASELTFRERYWSPIVLIRGAMALVWAPYEFQVDGEVAHCGYDAFSLSKINGIWKISNASWTVEPDACEALYPKNNEPFRPVK